MNTPISAILERKGSAVYSVNARMSIADAVAEMNRHRVGCVLVLDGDLLVGVFTERDVLRRVVGMDVDPKINRVADVMTRDVITIPPHTTVDECLTTFAERRCRHLPVIEHGRLVGLISIGDISRWVADMHRAEAESLKNYVIGGDLVT
ncbi:MAG: CBS domain-containing protein [Opitutus sp.]|nr:CBS domain-containing protein [Opitutus sp.]